MKFKNKKTGIVWDINNETHIKRLQSNKDYEKVAEKKTTSKTTKTNGNKTQAKKTNTKQTTTEK
ncbi:hypothetical protein MUN88_17065 [Gracilibacillus caseinilyticus]|uniref:Uncharacterized protein n=1 Tax=Gracilibacillus caseinilyticus TaxID=2932256 RepID=A0ABY4EU46_9BACI|nr:hypothetical protein [Gracilibacillus caseinilyticus]UOQ47743.1 hypothetical protein MUN88_17065 [Gracilibacillus caseinilyticus]